MKEIETKILEIDRQSLEKTLTKLGAKKVFDGDIETFFFDFKDGAIIKAKNVLRLRNELNKTELTFKEVQVTQIAKVAEEYNVEVSNFDKMKKILENLGLFVIDDTKKHRISYVLDQVRFDIDRYYGEYDYIPEFLEIEAENTDLIHRHAALLGFKAKDCLPWSTSELVRHYSKKAKPEV